MARAKITIKFKKSEWSKIILTGINRTAVVRTGLIKKEIHSLLFNEFYPRIMETQLYKWVFTNYEARGFFGFAPEDEQDEQVRLRDVLESTTRIWVDNRGTAQVRFGDQFVMIRKLVYEAEDGNDINWYKWVSPDGAGSFDDPSAQWALVIKKGAGRSHKAIMAQKETLKKLAGQLGVTKIIENPTKWGILGAPPIKGNTLVENAVIRNSNWLIREMKRIYLSHALSGDFPARNVI